MPHPHDEPQSGDHGTVVPPVPIPNTEVKRCCADDSMAKGYAKVGRCQIKHHPASRKRCGIFCARVPRTKTVTRRHQLGLTNACVRLQRFPNSFPKRMRGDSRRRLEDKPPYLALGARVPSAGREACPQPAAVEAHHPHVRACLLNGIEFREPL